MMRALLVLIGLFSATAAALAQPSVVAVRIGEHPDKTRFVMELSEEPRYRIFTLPDPFRVVIDLPELDWKPPAEALPGGSGLIAAMRFGLFAPGTSRVVLDAKSPVEVQNVFVMAPQDGHANRLVLDIVPVSREAFFESARGAPITSKTPLEPVRTVFVPPRPKADQRPTIVIDPGHGGVDPGARSISGVDEKAIALTYARDLKRRLETVGRYRVVLTREKDIFIRLRDRMALAERMDGDLFVSLHANNHKSRKVRGVSVYTLSEKASDAEAGALAARENKADVIAGIDLSDQTEVVSMILIDLAQRETMNLSKQFANMLVEEAGKVTRLLANTHRFAGFAVLKSPTVPSVLVEIGYLSNRTEERLLRSAAHRAKVTSAIVEAVKAYFEWQENLNRS
ncbi:MAG: N-acetylmuramoyl-L-alanine amidase [Kiloniellaceae bacterium]